MTTGDPAEEGQAVEVVNAEPTKDFFISMLVRDIGLIPAIVDLVDNCIDGARRLRPRNRFDGLTVAIRAHPESFVIEDNCGGIPWQTARDYAFRFGRPSEAPPTPSSIGQFGIGMKRALFKLGRDFTVRSTTTAGERFVLKVDVDGWRGSPSWTFDDVERSAGHTGDEAGTTIEVLRLYPTVADQFGQNLFETELSEELSRVHQESMANGLKISLNGIPVDVDLLTLLQSNELGPANLTLTLDEDTSTPVRVRLSAGIDASSPSDAGWYVYCNGRLILGPDRSSITGWGEGQGRMIPQYHNQFARFRGYVFFDSASVEKLPWTTTKEGVDAGHEMYRAVRPRMIDLMRPVIDFLNALDAERDNPAADQESLESIVTRAESHPVALSDLRTSSNFVTPVRRVTPKRPATQSIQYRRPIKQIDAIKEKLGVGSAGRVGEETFDYYYERECNDYE